MRARRPMRKTREQVMKLRRDLAGLWDAFGASHHQMGRSYAYASQLSSAARATAVAIKGALDPQGSDESRRARTHRRR